MRFPKRYLFQILFFLCVGIPYIDDYELTFFVWIFTAAVSLSHSYSIGILKFTSFYIGIFILAVIATFAHDYKAYYIIRDATYLLKPIIGILIGYQLCRRIDFKNTFKTVIYTGVIIALIHYLVIINAMVQKHAFTVNEIRLNAGMFSDFEVYVLIILLFHDKFELDLTKKQIRYFSWIVALSAFLYMARTNFVQFLILFLAMKGYFKINRTSLMAIAVAVGFVAIGYSAILYINPKRNGPGIEALLYKIKVAPVEPFKTKIDVDNWKDLNDNYRSYENIRTVKQVTRSGSKATYFGLGMGSRIDLKREIWLRENLRYISILHNGFMTVFLKSGLVGVLLSLASILMLIRQRKSSVPILRNINLLLVGTGIFMLFSNWVFMGFYNLIDSKSILIGLLICFKEMVVKDQKVLVNQGISS